MSAFDPKRAIAKEIGEHPLQRGRTPTRAAESGAPMVTCDAPAMPGGLFRGFIPVQTGMVEAHLEIYFSVSFDACNTLMERWKMAILPT